MDPYANGPSRHARHVFEVVRRGVASDTPERITGSWSRCVREYGLDPLRWQAPPVLDRDTMESRRRRIADLIECADLEMSTLYQQLGDSEAALVLTDAEGVVVHTISSPELAHDLAQFGLRVGAVWSEEKAGTNGMGTCIVARAPVTVRQAEHFFANCGALTCCAAPIFDPQGTILGALDITTRSKEAQQYALVLVNGAAQRIENRLLDVRYRDAYPIHFHSRPEMVHTLHEGRLVVASDGRIQGANRRAIAQLGYRLIGDVTSRRMEDLFGADLREVLERSYRNSFHPVATHREPADKTFFVVAQQPIGAPKRTPLAVGASFADPPGSIGDFEFGDPRITAKLAMAKRIVERRIPILLYGETGVGKEVFARALHRVGPVADGEFVVVDCAALAESALDALFDGGAAARSGRTGRGARPKSPACVRGTLFLDEIGRLSPDAQAMLLHKLDMLGAARAQIDFQIVGASHCSLGDVVRRGQFRDDLYYRLCGLEIAMPPLRERTDIAALVHRMLHDEIGASYELDAEAERLLVSYGWPGNARQLRHVLQTAAALAEGSTITRACVVSLMPDVPPRPPGEASRAAEPALDVQVAAQDDPRAAMLHTLEQHRWNVSRVAESLGISRNTLYRRLHRLDIDVSH